MTGLNAHTANIVEIARGLLSDDSDYDTPTSEARASAIRYALLKYLEDRRSEPVVVKYGVASAVVDIYARDDDPVWAASEGISDGWSLFRVEYRGDVEPSIEAVDDAFAAIGAWKVGDTKPCHENVVESHYLWPNDHPVTQLP